MDTVTIHGVAMLGYRSVNFSFGLLLPLKQNFSC